MDKIFKEWVLELKKIQENPREMVIWLNAKNQNERYYAINAMRGEWDALKDELLEERIDYVVEENKKIRYATLIDVCKKNEVLYSELISPFEEKLNKENGDLIDTLISFTTKWEGYIDIHSRTKLGRDSEEEEITTSTIDDDKSFKVTKNFAIFLNNIGVKLVDFECEWDKRLPLHKKKSFKDSIAVLKEKNIFIDGNYQNNVNPIKICDWLEKVLSGQGTPPKNNNHNHYAIKIRLQEDNILKLFEELAESENRNIFGCNKMFVSNSYVIYKNWINFPLEIADKICLNLNNSEINVVVANEPFSVNSTVELPILKREKWRDAFVAKVNSNDVILDEEWSGAEVTKCWLKDKDIEIKNKADAFAIKHNTEIKEIGNLDKSGFMTFDLLGFLVEKVNKKESINGFNPAEYICENIGWRRFVRELITVNGSIDFSIDCGGYNLLHKIISKDGESFLQNVGVGDNPKDEDKYFKALTKEVLNSKNELGETAFQIIIKDENADYKPWRNSVQRRLEKFLERLDELNYDFDELMECDKSIGERYNLNKSPIYEKQKLKKMVNSNAKDLISKSL